MSENLQTHGRQRLALSRLISTNRSTQRSTSESDLYCSGRTLRFLQSMSDRAAATISHVIGQSVSYRSASLGSEIRELHEFLFPNKCEALMLTFRVRSEKLRLILPASLVKTLSESVLTGSSQKDRLALDEADLIACSYLAICFLRDFPLVQYEPCFLVAASAIESTPWDLHDFVDVERGSLICRFEFADAHNRGFRLATVLSPGLAMWLQTASRQSCCSASRRLMNAISQNLNLVAEVQVKSINELSGLRQGCRLELARVRVETQQQSRLRNEAEPSSRRLLSLDVLGSERQGKLKFRVI